MKKLLTLLILVISSTVLYAQEKTPVKLLIGEDLNSVTVYFQELMNIVKKRNVVLKEEVTSSGDLQLVFHASNGDKLINCQIITLVFKRINKIEYCQKQTITGFSDASANVNLKYLKDNFEHMERNTYFKEIEKNKKGIEANYHVEPHGFAIIYNLLENNN